MMERIIVTNSTKGKLRSIVGKKSLIVKHKLMIVSLTTDFLMAFIYFEDAPIEGY